jgi:hypothetical protein
LVTEDAILQDYDEERAKSFEVGVSTDDIWCAGMGWAEAMVCLYPHDVDEVLKVRPMQHGREDFVAWYYEKSGIFMVKAAYRLAMEEKRRSEGLEASSSGATDGWPLYKNLRNADVPPKVRFFAWKLVADGLATQDKRSKRGMAPNGICQVCGNEIETGHHAVVECTKIAALWKEMR